MKKTHKAFRHGQEIVSLPLKGQEARDNFDRIFPNSKPWWEKENTEGQEGRKDLFHVATKC